MGKNYNLITIILTLNEEIHIERCINSLLPLTTSIIIIDSYSTDHTIEIATNLCAKVFEHRFINQAKQLNWALDQLDPKDGWVMRMDADEYLEDELVHELNRELPKLPDNIDGIYLKRKVFFGGKWIRHGGFYPHILLRIWRNGKGRAEQRWMDEHIALPVGSKTIIAQGHLIDDNQKGISFWIDKHNQYASREAVELLNLKYPLFARDQSLQGFDDPQAKKKRYIKEKYYSRLPAVFRAFIYYFYRYFLKLGFLDGYQGFVWHFMQGFWYRLLVDVKMMEIEKKSGGDIEKMRQIITHEHGIDLSQ
jgi:glycosyltransferase involved in cell wall biosynthesis